MFKTIIVLAILATCLNAQAMKICLAKEMDIKKRLSGSYRRLQAMTNVCKNDASCCEAADYTSISGWKAAHGDFTKKDLSRFHDVADVLLNMATDDSTVGLKSDWLKNSVCTGKSSSGLPVKSWTRRLQAVKAKCFEGSELVRIAKEVKTAMAEWQESVNACSDDVDTGIKSYFCTACNNTAGSMFKFDSATNTRTTWVQSSTGARYINVSCGAALRGAALNLVNLLLAWEQLMPKARRLQAVKKTPVSDSHMQQELVGFDYDSCANRIIGAASKTRRLQAMKNIVQLYPECAALAKWFINDFVCEWSTKNRFTDSMKTRAAKVVHQFGNQGAVDALNKLFGTFAGDKKRILQAMKKKHTCDFNAADWKVGLNWFA